VLVQRARVREQHLEQDRAASEWPFSVPAVAQVVAEGLEFRAPVTVLVGENGTGKSTLVEAVAERFGLDAAGGKAGTRYASNPEGTRTRLGQVLRLDTTSAGSRMLAGPRRGKRAFFLRSETAHTLTERLGGRLGFWEEDTSSMSHGEAYRTVFDAMMADPGFYVMDEPESALSFSSCLGLVARMLEQAACGGQVVCATHSPVLAACTGADVLELGAHGVRRTTWGELDLVDHWRRFMADPQAYLRHLRPEVAGR
jgi:predicted ATPase